MLITREGSILNSEVGVVNARRMQLKLPEVAERDIPLPYQNALSPEEHMQIKRDICIYLFDTGVIGLDECEKLDHLFERQLDKSQWAEVSPHPEDYWFIVVANQLTDERSQSILGNNLYKREVFTTRSKQNHYNLNQMTWFGRAAELYPLNHFGKEPGVEELLEEIVPKIAPVYRAFYAIKTGTGRRVNYLNREGLRRMALYKRASGEEPR